MLIKIAILELSVLITEFHFLQASVLRASSYVRYGSNFSDLSHFRLAYHQRMVDIVPENFGPFVPEKPQPSYKYEGEQGQGQSLELVHASMSEQALQPINWQSTLRRCLKRT